MSQSWKRSATGAIMVLFLVTQFCYYSAATNGFKQEVESSKEEIVTIMNATYLNNANMNESEKTAFVAVLGDLCSFYQSIKDYKEITNNDSTNVTKAIRIVLNETYNDSCEWLYDKLGNTNFNCAAINSRNVTELCITVEAAVTTKDLEDELKKIVEAQGKDINEN